MTRRGAGTRRFESIDRVAACAWREVDVGRQTSPGRFGELGELGDLASRRVW
ncbi:MAG: hypothetical protein IJE97_09075 [Thermoguttaceae bacterium]|nr:hypothetical protein [Thermoguttaceae bacterium]